MVAWQCQQNIQLKSVLKAIERERHITPTIDDISTELTGTQLFSQINLNNRYHQLVLHEESIYIYYYIYNTCWSAKIQRIDVLY